MPKSERKVDFLDALAFGSATPEQRKRMNEAYLAKKEKQEAKEKSNDKDGNKKSSKSSTSSKPSESSKSSKSFKSKFSGMSHHYAGGLLIDAGNQRNNSVLHSGHGSHRDDRSSLPLLDEGPRPSTAPASHARSRKSKPKKSSTREAFKNFGRQLFGTAPKPTKKNSGHTVPGKWVDSPESSRSRRHSSRRRTRSTGRSPRHRPLDPMDDVPEGEEAEMYIESSYDHSRIDRWINDVDEQSLGASGVPYSDHSRARGRNREGYNLSNFPMRSDRETYVGSNLGSVLPSDSVTQAGQQRCQRRHRRH